MRPKCDFCNSLNVSGANHCSQCGAPISEYYDVAQNCVESFTDEGLDRTLARAWAKEWRDIEKRPRQKEIILAEAIAKSNKDATNLLLVEAMKDDMDRYWCKDCGDHFSSNKVVNRCIYCKSSNLSKHVKFGSYRKLNWFDRVSLWMKELCCIIV